MNKVIILILFGLLLCLISCSSPEEEEEVSVDPSALDFSSTADFAGSATSSRGSGVSTPGNKPGGVAGKITAGEWRDLDEWSFWEDIISNSDFEEFPSYWDLYNDHRISIILHNNNRPIVDAELELNYKGHVVWRARTDNSGKAELWANLFEYSQSIDIKDYTLSVNGRSVDTDLKLIDDGINEINLRERSSSNTRVELSFIVDATGSMGDELEFLKQDLQDVIRRVLSDNSSLDIFTSSVFYRDVEDDYITVQSEFTGDLNTTLRFINNQQADGGGDYPEAVHSALDEGVNNLNWSEAARTRIAFLLLDAPPHHEPQVISDLKNSIAKAAAKGIKIIPITASGIDKETEFLMRFMSMSTNGTYVFITDDSGIGNDHLEATVGDFDVELLNDLMVRPINEYSE